MYRTSVIALSILLLTNLPSLYYGWYLDFSWLDTLQHFLGGLFVGMFMCHYLREHLIRNKSIPNALIVLGATIFIGVVWEFAEFIANQTLIDFTYNTFGITAYFMGDLNDTITDLLMDISGALTFFIFATRQINRRTQSD